MTKRNVVVTPALISEAESVGWVTACIRRLGWPDPALGDWTGRVHVDGKDISHKIVGSRTGGELTRYLNKQLVFEFDKLEELG